ncbi:cupin domain-containing protein [Cupriavidus basilensis]|uniref:cupin domain-containing protein n=1 Tax=Cupriavidus basilensis TaxID=68895 RepID=UPI0039F6B3BF
MRRTLASLSLCMLGGWMAAGPAAAQSQSLPTERVGVNGKELAAVKLTTDFSVSKGRTLRMREVTIAPGGILPMHSHADRPSVSYVLKGTLTEYLDGETEGKQIGAGQSYATQGARMHALQNKGDVPAVFLEVDLP